MQLKDYGLSENISCIRWGELDWEYLIIYLINWYARINYARWLIKIVFP